MSTFGYKHNCALAHALELLGERWTLLVVRELLLGPQRFTDLLERLKGVTPSVLTGRLKALTEQGVIAVSVLPPPAARNVYRLTERGEGLRAVVYAMMRWGEAGEVWRAGDHFEPEWAMLAFDARRASGPAPKRRIALEVTHKQKRARILVEGGPKGVAVSLSEAPGDVLARGRFPIVWMIAAGVLDAKKARAAGDLEIEGDVRALADLAAMFEM